jgi:glycosyltransferase involved in cell wall biosynthesis
MKNENRRPSVSALLPIYNGATWFDTSIPIIQATLGLHDELIIVDDGSEDSTWNKIKEVSKNDSRIVPVRQPRSGIVKALNLGIKISSREWIARFDIDDKYPVDRLDRQFEIAEKYPNVGVIFSDYEIWRRGMDYVGTIPSPLFDLQTKISLYNSQRTAHPSALIRKSAAVEVGGYQQFEFPAEDLGLWIRISNLAELRSSPHIGLFYNRNQNSVSVINRKSALEKREMLRKYIKVDRDELERLFLDLKNHRLYEGCRDSSIRSFLFAVDTFTFAASESSGIVGLTEKAVKRLSLNMITRNLFNSEVRDFSYCYLKRRFPL